MRRHWMIAGIAASALAVAATPAAAAPPRGDAVVVRARFAATMPDRFGLDADGDGLIDLPNSAGYVQGGHAGACGASCPPAFTLRLDGAPSTATMGGVSLLVVSYLWEVSGPGGRHIVRRGAGPRLEVDLPEGRYQVSLEVEASLPWGSARGRSTREVAVEDLLVVAMGDSFAAGEGNPERPRAEGTSEAQWADAPGDPETEKAHAAAHRSTVAWPALAALALEHADPGTSVTFLSVAATKAQVTAGLLGPQPNVSPVSQIDQVAALVGERRIDLLLVSVGGNDIGFARIVRGLVDADRLADPVCYATDLQNVWDAASDGDWNRDSALRFALPWGVGCRAVRVTGRPVLPGLQGLPAELDRLAEAIAVRLDPAAVYLMEYPDPTGASAGEAACGEIVGDVTPPFRFHEIDRAEMAAGWARVVEPLNRILAEAAARHGWEFVGGASAAFAAGHGYCALRPDYAPGAGEAAPAGLLQTALAGSGRWYRHSASLQAATALAAPGVSWWRTAAQSVVLQGPSDAWETMGTLHPNELGHLAMAQALLAAVGD
jgi:lysophospholipase L1-like esterase